MTKFRTDLADKLEHISPEHDLEYLVTMYNSKLRETLDEHAPLQEKVVTVREKTPWTNNGLKPWKVKRRQVERRMRRTGLQVDRQEYSKFNREYNEFLEKTRSDYFRRQIEDNKGDPKTLFNVMNETLNKTKDNLVV